ncbi:MAG: ribonuclease P protein component [Cyclobacteriaceae bacterium]
MEQKRAHIEKHLNTFRKPERLNQKKLIALLFQKGKSFFSHPLATKYLPQEIDLGYHQILISVPKKKIKKAHQRNLIKRRIREAYRQNKSAFDFQSHWLIAYIYSSEDILSYKEIEDKLKDSLLRLSKTEENSRK